MSVVVTNAAMDLSAPGSILDFTFDALSQVRTIKTGACRTYQELVQLAVT